MKLKESKSGDNKGKYQIEVNGFDYYNPKTGKAVAVKIIDARGIESLKIIRL